MHPSTTLKVEGDHASTFIYLVKYAAHTAAAASVSAAAASQKRKAAEWTPKAGCDCASTGAHTAHVKKCQAWPCSCKPARVGKGGDSSHTDACMRGRYASHTVPFIAPRAGDKVAMIDDARRAGLPDLVFNAKAGWVADPQGRSVERSAWVVGPAQSLG